MKDQKTIELKYPIQVSVGEEGDVQTITSLTFGRLKVKHLRSLPSDFMENEGQNIELKDMIPIIASLADITEDAAGELDLEDLMEVAEVLQHFFEQFLPTGKTQ